MKQRKAVATLDLQQPLILGGFSMEDFVDFDLTVTEFMNAIYRKHSSTWINKVKNRPAYGLVYFYKGVLELKDSTSVYEILPDTVVWLPKGYAYQFCGIGDENVEFIALTFLMEGKNLPFRILQIPQNNKEIAILFSDVMELVSAKETAYMLSIKSKMAWIIYMLLRIYTETSNNHASLHASIAHIHKHLADKMSVETLAKISGYTPSYYRRVFQRAFGMPPVQYINLKRVEKAKKMLLSGLYTKSEIARLCGFENQQFFARVFKKYTGKTPSEFCQV